jgi:hypothetical protein
MRAVAKAIGRKTHRRIRQSSTKCGSGSAAIILRGSFCERQAGCRTGITAKSQWDNVIHQRAACSVQRAACSVQRAACSVQRAALPLGKRGWSLHAVSRPALLEPISTGECCKPLSKPRRRSSLRPDFARPFVQLQTWATFLAGNGPDNLSAFDSRTDSQPLCQSEQTILVSCNSNLDICTCVYCKICFDAVQHVSMSV